MLPDCRPGLLTHLLLLRISVPPASDTLMEAASISTDSIPVTVDTLTQAAKDSLMKEARYILELLNEPHSFFTFETSIGNRNFSLHNNSFNALQLTTDKFTLVPTATYVHKSGSGASAAAYMTWDKNPQFFQYALSPSYDHFGKNSATAFHTHTILQGMTWNFIAHQ